MVGCDSETVVPPLLDVCKCLGGLRLESLVDSSEFTLVVLADCLYLFPKWGNVGNVVFPSGFVHAVDLLVHACFLFEVCLDGSLIVVE